jgi:hypothetical protein
MHQIAFSYNANNLAEIVDDGNRTYAVFEQDFCDFPDGRSFPYGNYGRNHHIARPHDQASIGELSAHIFGRALPDTELIRIKPAHLAAT